MHDDDDLPVKPKHNRRKVHIKRQMFLSAPGRNAGRMVREISPRKVQCGMCATAIMGNDEERIHLDLKTGISGDLGDQFWKRRIDVYFHPQCLVAFITGDDRHLIKKGEVLYHWCDSCDRWGRHPLCADGERRCKFCMPAYRELMNRAQVAERGLDEIASSSDM